MTPRIHHLLGLAVAAGATLVLLFGIGALGIVGSGGPPDLLYVGALVVGLVVAAAGRFRPPALARGLGTTAALMLVAGVVAVAAGLQEDGSVVDVLALSAMFAGLYGAAAWLLHRASGSPTGVTAG
jgi:hypothetical protein